VISANKFILLYINSADVPIRLITLDNRRIRDDLIEVFTSLKGYEGIDKNMLFMKHIYNALEFYEMA